MPETTDRSVTEQEGTTMNKHGAPLTYADPSGNPVLSQRYTLTPAEVEVIEVRDLIVAEGVASPGKAGLLTIPALSSAEPAFIEWLTCGLLTIDTTTGWATTEPDVLSWMSAVRKTGRVF